MRKRSGSGLRARRPRLETLGIDLEYFPGYVNLKPRMHGLDVVLLSFIVRGSGRHMMEDDIYEESGCSLGVTHYGQQHSIVTDEQGMDVMNIYLDPQNHPLPVLPGALREVLPEILPLHPAFQHRLNRIVRIQFDRPEEATNLVFAMYRELEESREGFREAVLLYFKLFLVCCCRQALATGMRPSVSRGSAGTPAVEELRRYLDSSYARRHRLRDLARQAGLSRTYLCRAFKAYTGKSVFDYLLDRRVQAAMLMLRSSDDKILSVALDAGFRDLPFFNRTFKARVGTTPGMYRRRWRGERRGE